MEEEFTMPQIEESDLAQGAGHQEQQDRAIEGCGDQVQLIRDLRLFEVFKEKRDDIQD
jgi:hypothetical protein